MDRTDYEFLKHCLNLTYDSGTDIWYKSHDNMTRVARILDYECLFSCPKNVIYYMEKPWKWEMDMWKLIQEYEEEQIEREWHRLPAEHMRLALEWLTKFGYSESFIDHLEYKVGVIQREDRENI